MKSSKIFFSAFVMTAMMVSCGGSGSGDPQQASPAREIKIGNQIWMSANLNVDKFRNGDPIPQAKTDDEWQKAVVNKRPAWCYYDNDNDNGAKYGKLYNWYAVNDARGLAPAGWHVPSDEEWTQLTEYLGGERVAGTKMKSTGNWYHKGNGTNTSGFLGLPGGSCDSLGKFIPRGRAGLWWSSTENNAEKAWFRNLYYSCDDVYRGSTSKQKGFSVRCLRD